MESSELTDSNSCLDIHTLALTTPPRSWVELTARRRRLAGAQPRGPRSGLELTVQPASRGAGKRRRRAGREEGEEGDGREGE